MTLLNSILQYSYLLGLKMLILRSSDLLGLSNLTFHRW